MHMHLNKRVNRKMTLTAVAAAVSLLAACGGGGGSDSPAAAPGTPLNIQGSLSDSIFKAGSTTDPTMAPTFYQNAQICVDKNSNGKCDSDENPVRTDAVGKFALTVLSTDTVLADIGTDATNSEGTAVAKRNAFRVSPQQLNEQPTAVAISPLSAEIMRMMEADHIDYATAKTNLATRLGISANDVVSDVNAATGTTQTAMLNEENALSERYAYAMAKLDRGDLYPDALAVPGGDPRLNGMAGVTQEIISNKGADTRKPITFKQSQQAAFNIEGIPRYDNIFIVMLENKATKVILDSPDAPNINHYLQTGNQLTSYFATGNPSEPNYTALGGADDFGIADDNQWNCDATGANAVQDTEPTAANFPGVLDNSPFTSPCTKGKANHNIVGKRNLFNTLTNAGLTWRTYSESMNPGQDFRTDSVGDAAVTAADNNDGSIILPLPGSLYKTKHHPGMAYQNVRSAPEFTFSNRTLGGGQWDATLLANSTAYPNKTFKDGRPWNIDQFGDDLASGNVGTLNFVVPDQCDDMHGTSVKSADGTQTATDCGGTAIIQRGDKYVKYLVDKIQASPLWKNRQKRVAIVLMFDEGSATGGINNSCCGWNAGGNINAAPLKEDGTPDASIDQYSSGNKGHGESIFGILTNTAATEGVKDTDAYSHFSFVRTLQDMFGLADPADDFSYMNRSRYTEKFVAENILNLPEYQGSANTHFDSVRPINHAFVAPATYTQIQSSDVTSAPQTGPDVSQRNVWALK